MEKSPDSKNPEESKQVDKDRPEKIPLPKEQKVEMTNQLFDEINR